MHGVRGADMTPVLAGLFPLPVKHHDIMLQSEKFVTQMIKNDVSPSDRRNAGFQNITLRGLKNRSTADTMCIDRKISGKRLACNCCKPFAVFN